MKRSESIVNLAAALCKFQGMMKNPPKTKTATIPTNKGTYSYKYADLGVIRDTIAEPLAKCGLAWVQQPVEENGVTKGVKTIVFHESGEWIEFEPVYISAGPNASPQQIGSALTYARRYSLCLALGIVSDEDDDAQAASTNGNGSEASKSQQRQGKPAEKKPMVAEIRKAEAAQITNELQAQDRSQYINGMKEAANNLNAMAHDPEQTKKDVADREKEGRKQLAILAREKGLTDEERKAIIKAETGKDSTTELKLSQLIEMYQFFKKHTPEQLKEIAKAHLIRMKASQPNTCLTISDDEIEAAMGGAA